MRLVGILSVSVFFLFLAISPAVADCSRCDGEGHEVCKNRKHKDLFEYGYDPNLFLCTDCLEQFDCCFGLGWTVCEKCEDPDARAFWDRRHGEMKEQVLEAREWFEGRVRPGVRDRDFRQIPTDKEGHFISVIAHPNVVLFSNLLQRQAEIPKKRGRPKRVRMDSHEARHLYAARCYRTIDILKRLHGEEAKEEGELPEVKELDGVRNYIILMQHEILFRSAMANVLGSDNRDVSMISSPGDPGIVATYDSSGLYPADTDLHQTVTHGLFHNLVSQYGGYDKDDPEVPAWFDAGFVHLMDQRLWGNNEPHCMSESQDLSGWDGYNWNRTIFQAIRRKKHPPLADVWAMKLDDMDQEAHQTAYSCVDYLLRTDREKFFQLLKKLRKEGGFPERLREVYGLSTYQFEEEWLDFVKDEYK